MEPAEADAITDKQGWLFTNMELLQQEWQECVLHAKQAGKLQGVDETQVTNRIRACFRGMMNLMEATKGPLLRAARNELAKATLSVQGGLPVAGDSSTPSPCPEAKASQPGPRGKNVDKGLHPEPTCQPSTSGVKEGEINLRPMTGQVKVDTDFIEISPSWQMYQNRWEKLLTRKGINPGNCRVDVGGKYPRVWTTPGANPQDVKEWYEFGALASVYTTSPSFTEIKGLPKWIQKTVFEAWENNESLKRGDVLELYFFSAAPEPVGKGIHEVFHFIKLRRPDTGALNRIKVPDFQAEIVSTFKEDQISTRRAWGLWVCLTEMDKMKTRFKFYQSSDLGSFLINTMTGTTTPFAEKSFENKRQTLWDNKIAGSKETRRKFCNMTHVSHWTEKACDQCSTQKEPEFGKGFFPKPDRRRFRSDEHEERQTPKGRAPRAPKK